MKRTLAEWLSWQETLHLSEIDLGLERIRSVAEALDILSPNFPIITVAGTNGKGSSVAFLEAILRAEGYATGSYTSPHLIDYNERIKLDTNNAPDSLIINAFEAIDKARGDTSLTYFEFGTLAAMWIFNQQKVDVAILEVGLGGRLDAANLWNTSLAIITSIGIDHVDWLGDDRELIGVEKAGIMRKGVPAICGDLDPPKAIASEAKRIGVTLYQIDKEFSYTHPPSSGDFWYWQGLGGRLGKNSNQSYALPLPNLAGEFQLNNAATVIAGLQAISALLPVSKKAIEQGLKSAQILGRLQYIFHQQPPQQQTEWLIDVAHNPHAAKQLAYYLEKNPIKGKTIALFSILKDKDISQVISVLSPFIEEWHIVELKGDRSTPVKHIEAAIKKNDANTLVIQHHSFTDAIKFIDAGSNLDKKTADRVVAFGSFLVVSDVIKTMRLFHGEKCLV